MTKDELKELLTIDQIVYFVNEHGGDGHLLNADSAVFRTICHNPIGEGSHKLFYYNNTRLFVCYTECSDNGAFDIFDLITKIKVRENKNWNLINSIIYLANYFNYDLQWDAIDDSGEELEDWTFFKAHEVPDYSQNLTLQPIDSNVLHFFPSVHIANWEKEGISFDVLKYNNILFDPVSQGIIIPHFNIDGKLIGIRERTLIKEYEQYGKYRPACLQGKMYNHPLSLNLYGLDKSKTPISILKKAIVMESEKSVLKYMSYFGVKNSIAVACCGSSLSSYQISLLTSLGVEEIIIGFDRQFKEKNDQEFHNWVKKLTNISNKFSSKANISFMFDKENLLDYKDAPIDKGKDVFLHLLNNRFYADK